MGYIGKWAFHSAGMISDEDQWVFLSAEEYLHSPMPYVDETDEDAVADELRERKQMIGSKLAVCEDGKMYLLMPIPEGVTQEQVDAAAAAGQIKVFDGMLTDEPYAWEERDGQLYADLGAGAEDLVCISGEDGFLTIMTMRYARVD